jgi:hypothetical protein
MNENNDLNKTIDEALDQISSHGFDALGEILNNPESNGVDIIAGLLAMPDNDFEILRPIFQEAIVKTYEDPQSQMQLIKLFAQSGISIEDIVNHSDEIADQMFNKSDVPLS